MAAQSIEILRTSAASTPTRGRPCKANAKSAAERAKDYRDRLKADGLKEVKCYLSPEHIAYLKVLCEIHGGTVADAVALALTALMRGELPAQSSGSQSRPGTALILLS